MEVYKVFMGFTGVDVGVFFDLAVMEGLRGHSRKLGKRGCRLDVRKNFFSNRVVNAWNELPEEIVMSDSLHKFKKLLDKFLDGRGMV